MHRRIFLKMLSGLPFLGFLSIDKSEPKKFEKSRKPVCVKDSDPIICSLEVVKDGERGTRFYYRSEDGSVYSKMRMECGCWTDVIYPDYAIVLENGGTIYGWPDFEIV